MLEEGYNKPKYCQQGSNVLEGDNSVDFFSALKPRDLQINLEAKSKSGGQNGLI